MRYVALAILARRRSKISRASVHDGFNIGHPFFQLSLALKNIITAFCLELRKTIQLERLRVDLINQISNLLHNVLLKKLQILGLLLEAEGREKRQDWPYRHGEQKKGSQRFGE